MSRSERKYLMRESHLFGFLMGASLAVYGWWVPLALWGIVAWALWIAAAIREADQ